MNENKIAVIICVNNQDYLDECIFYLDRLLLPDGFTMELYTVVEADSIFQAYNQAMRQTNAKYKIYMHQDLFLIDKTLVIRCINFFRKNKGAGVLGLLGGTEIPKDKRFYKSRNKGYVIACSEKQAFYNDLCRDTVQVQAVDGMFFMTQFDLQWRDDILTGWDFYDFSQSLEFRKAGYEVWVLGGEKPTAFHDCGYLNLTRYDRALNQFLNNYAEDFPCYEEMPEVYPESYCEQYRIREELLVGWKQLWSMGEYPAVCQMFRKVEDERFFSTDTAILKNVIEIQEAEMKKGIDSEVQFLSDCEKFDDIIHKYVAVKFYLRRQQYAKGDEGKCPAISDVAYDIIKKHCLVEERQ